MEIAGLHCRANKNGDVRYPIARMHDNIGDHISGCSPHVVSLLQEPTNYARAMLSGATEDMQYGAPVFLTVHGALVS